MRRLMDKFIVLNVGGTIFVTAKETLLVKDSYFEKRFCGKMDPGYEIEGGAFIDRSPKLFEYILEFLRKLDNWYVPDSLELLCDLVEEAKFYGLEQIITKIKKKIHPKGAAFEISLRNFPYEDKWYYPMYALFSHEPGRDITKFIKPRDNVIVEINKWYVTKFPHTLLLSTIESYFSPKYMLKETHTPNKETKTFVFVDVYQGPAARELRKRLYK